MTAGFAIPSANIRRAVAKKARRNAKKARTPSEEQLHLSVAKYLNILQAQGHLLWFHPANGGSRNVIEAVKLKRMGVSAGVPDIVLIPRMGPVLFIELKSESGRVSPEQQAWMEALREHGCPAEVCRSLDEVKQFLIVNAIIRDVA